MSYSLNLFSLTNCTQRHIRGKFSVYPGQLSVNMTRSSMCVTFGKQKFNNDGCNLIFYSLNFIFFPQKYIPFSVRIIMQFQIIHSSKMLGLLLILERDETRMTHRLTNFAQQQVGVCKIQLDFVLFYNISTVHNMINSLPL